MRLGLQLAPELVGAPQQRHVVRVLPVRHPDDARQAVRRPAVVRDREPLDACNRTSIYGLNRMRILCCMLHACVLRHHCCFFRVWLAGLHVEQLATQRKLDATRKPAPSTDLPRAAQWYRAALPCPPTPTTMTSKCLWRMTERISHRVEGTGAKVSTVAG